MRKRNKRREVIFNCYILGFRLAVHTVNRCMYVPGQAGRRISCLYFALHLKLHVILADDRVGDGGDYDAGDRVDGLTLPQIEHSLLRVQ